MYNASLGKAYSQVHNMGGNPRATEARALMEAARRLAEAQKLVDEDQDAYRKALRLNWRLWTIIQSDVSSPDSPLPPDLKANIISLSIFVDKHTLAALAEPAAAKVAVLIDINRNIAAGLMSTPETAARAAAGDAPVPAAGPEGPRLKGDILT
jgi:flagellar protein FlaF